MAGPSRESRLLDAIVSLVDSLLDDLDVVELLTELTEHCVRLLDIASAGLLLADARRQLHLMAATSKATHDLEVIQLQADEGPCLDCYTTGEPVFIANLFEARARWPRFVDAATNAGFTSVHAVPMRAAGTVLGALGLFGSGTGHLTEADRLLAQTLAHIACVAILQEDAPTPDTVLPRLRTALSSRIVVEQAKGYLRERLDVSADDAFTLLRRYGQTYGEHLTDVSRRLLTVREQRNAIVTSMRQLTSNPT